MQPTTLTAHDPTLGTAEHPARRYGPAPLCRTDAVALFDHLHDALQFRDCTHGFRNTEQFLTAHHLELRSTLAWLRGHGARCDCEVLDKFESTWRAREYLAGIVCRLPKRDQRGR